MRAVVTRGAMAGFGAAAGLCLWLCDALWDIGAMPERGLLALTVFGAAFFATFLAMTGPLWPARAGLGAAGIAAVAAALASLAGLRFDRVQALFDAPHAALALAILIVLPVPFWIAANGRGWAHYPTLYAASWSVVVRGGAALMFTALVWAVVYLSDALLGLVGLTVIADLIDFDPVPWVLSGAVLGLALAVMTELADVVSPDLLLRLFRLLVPVLLVVVSVFLVALALRGFDRLFGGLSEAGTLIAVAAAAVALVSVAVDGDDAEAVASRPMVLATQALAALVVVPAGLAAWALWLRVDDAGFTPARLAGLAAAALAMGYGLAYLWALAGGRRWRARIRTGNVAMALAMLALAAAWLTPVLNAEAISARDQVARFEDGRTRIDRLDPAALAGWGRPGAAALDRLRVLAGDPARADLAARLADPLAIGTGDPAAARAALAAVLPVSPSGAVAGRAAILAALEPWEVETWRKGCIRRLPDGRPACVLVIADFHPETAAAEAMMLFLTPEGWLRHEAVIGGGEGQGWQRAATLSASADSLTEAEAAAALAALQDGPPVLRPLTQQGLQVGRAVLSILP